MGRDSKLPCGALCQPTRRCGLPTAGRKASSSRVSAAPTLLAEAVPESATSAPLDCGRCFRLTYSAELRTRRNEATSGLTSIDRYLRFTGVLPVSCHLRARGLGREGRRQGLSCCGWPGQSDLRRRRLNPRENQSPCRYADPINRAASGDAACRDQLLPRLLKSER